MPEEALANLDRASVSRALSKVPEEQRLAIVLMDLAGHSASEVAEIVATSAQPFPVPSTSHLLSGSSSQAWMATKGRFSMYGVNRRDGGESMFLVAAMPMAEMPQMAARLKLI